MGVLGGCRTSGTLTAWPKPTRQGRGCRFVGLPSTAQHGPETRDCHLGGCPHSSAAITEYPRLGGSHSRRLVLTALEAGRPRSGSVPGEVLLPGLPLCPHGAERANSGESSSCFKGSNPIMGPTLMTSSHPNLLPKNPPPSTTALGVRAST